MVDNLEVYEQEVLAQVESGLRDRDVDLTLLKNFKQRGLARYWRGYRVLREQAASSAFGPAPAYLFAALDPQDAGVGYGKQRSIYHALGGRSYAGSMGVLGALYNAIIGLIDRLTDDFPNLFPALQEAINARTLDALLRLECPAALPRPNFDSSVGAEGLAWGNTLLAGIEAYASRVRTLVEQSNRREVWDDFRAVHFELMAHQFASATLTVDSCEPSRSALATSMGRVVPFLWAYFVNAWSASDTYDVESRQDYRAPADAWGEAIVLSDDLCDLLLDLGEGRWNTVTLLAVLEFDVPLTPALVRGANDVVVTQLLETRVPELVAQRMCDSHRRAFAQFASLAPGRFTDLERFNRYGLCYPLLAREVSQIRRDELAKMQRSTG